VRIAAAAKSDRVLPFWSKLGFSLTGDIRQPRHGDVVPETSIPVKQLDGVPMTLSNLLIPAMAALLALPAAAGPYTDALGACLADNTSGRDRKDLAKWVFVAVSAHPDMQGLSATTEKTREDIYRNVGLLVTRLLTESCAEQTRTATTLEGSEALKSAFGSLGQLAMQELTTNQDVRTSIAGFEKYIDRKKLESALSVK
jgi:hypothetical protein